MRKLVHGYHPSFAACGAALAVALLAGGPLAMAQESILVGDTNKIVKLAYPSGTAQSHFLGVGMTPLSGLYAMAFGPDGNLYLSSFNTDSIIRIDGLTGAPLGNNGTFITGGLGGLDGATGFAWSPDGRLFVASYYTNSILIYNGTNGSYIDSFIIPGSGTLVNPAGIAFYNGFLYVCSEANDKVLRYNGTTGAFVDEVITTAQLGLNSPRGILFDAGGRMYVSSYDSGGRILVKDPVAGLSVLTSSATNPLMSYPWSMTLNPAGQLIVACYTTVQRIDRLTGTSLGTLVQSNAGGLGGDKTGVLYFPVATPCYANCDNSTAPPVLNTNDFQCFLNRFASGCT